ncbi:MAG: hypothetical protein IAG13_19385 [Deltaproteobacteria bacterium]|nr:hypothetical protein [Nannocystaceae bacterium]
MAVWTVLLAACTNRDDAAAVDETSSSGASMGGGDTFSSDTPPSSSSESTHGSEDSGPVADDSSTDDGDVGTSDGANMLPQANDDTLWAMQDQQLLVAAIDGLLTNDVDHDGPALSIVDADAVGSNGGLVNVEIDGSVAYTPA